MKIYTASSWKLQLMVRQYASLFREWGHEVYCFAEVTEGQHHFWWPDVVTLDDDGITCLDTEDSHKAFNVDFEHLNWAECCVLFNPCGRDAHLEAGYIKGQGKLLYILGLWPKGEYSNMYHLADDLFRYDGLGLDTLRDTLSRVKL